MILTLMRDASLAAPPRVLPGRFAPFDGLRAVAVLLVFAHHLAGRYVPGGWIGVDMFFALSGFLITSLLVDEFGRHGRVDMRAFLMRRALRLVPALVVHVALVTPVALVAGVAHVIGGALAALTYTTDFYAIAGGDSWIFGHTWSLTVEEQFYLLWPTLLILGLLRRRRMLGTLVGVTLLSVAAGAVIATTVSTSMAYALPFSHLPTLLGAAGLALALRRGANRFDWVGTAWIPVVAGAAVLSIVLLVDESTTWLYCGGMAALGAVLVLLVAHLRVRPTSRLARTLTLRPLVLLGERSYGFYLWHFPVSALAHHLDAPPPVAGLLAVTVSLALTEASWRLVERPFLRLKRRYTIVAGSNTT